MNFLKIELNPREDKNNKVYFTGRIEAPLFLDLRRGAAFLIFLSEEESEELQIAPLDNSQNLSFVSQKDNRYSIMLESRKDEFDKVFFVAKVKENIIINLFEGASFMVFTSKKGKEELQIIPSVIEKPKGIVYPEIIIKKRP